MFPNWSFGIREGDVAKNVAAFTVTEAGKKRLERLTAQSEHEA